MKVLCKFFQVVIPLFVLAGCADSGESRNPTDPDSVFNLFPFDYFNPGYSETYNLSGFDNNGFTQLGFFTVETRVQSIFNGESGIPVFTEIQVIDAQSGSFSITTKTEFLSIDSDDLRVLGFTNTLFGITPYFAFSSAAIPLTARIGDSGGIGTYIDGFGNENIQTWQLDDGGDGRARLEFFSTTRDNFGFRLSSIEERYLIEQDGERISMSVRFFNADSILTLTLSGDKA